MKKVFLTLALSLTVLSIASCSNSKEQHSYLADADSFLAAVNRGEETIYIDDISFESEKVISLNYPLKLIGKDNKSKLSNVCFDLSGTNVIGKQTNYNFSNIIFDGCIDTSNYDFSVPKKAFSEIFENDRTESNCFKVSVGYVGLNLCNCDVTRYASYNGPAIYVDNNALYRESDRTINIDNCKFYKNITYSGTVWIGHDKGITNIKNSEFYENLGKFASGIGIGNGKATIDNVAVRDNTFYHFLNESRADDMLHIGGVDYNYTNQTGALYVGGSDSSVTNCVISNNKGLFGAGIGFTTPEAKVEGQIMLFKDNVIKDNEAECGGAIYAKIGEGNVVKFINCSILNNKAKKGASMYATPRVPWMSANSGTMDYIFCTLANNNSEEANPAFDFYELKKADAVRKIEMHGTFAIDNAPFEDQSTNYVATKDVAIANGVITQEDLDNCSSKGLFPKKGSAADKAIPAETFKTWDKVFESEVNERAIGSSIGKPVATNYTVIIVSVSCSVCGAILIALIITLLLKRRKIQIETMNINEKLQTYSYDDLLNIVSNKLSSYNLTKKEFEVATHLLLCNSRKEMAEKQFVSEDTVKTHISHIFKKMNISSKNDLKKIIGKYL